MAATKTPNGGVKSDKIWRDALMRAVKRSTGDNDLKNLEKLAQKTVQLGLGGDMSAIKEIGDRLDGKPTQGVQALDENGKPTSMKIEVALVAGNNKG